MYKMKTGNSKAYGSTLKQPKQIIEHQESTDDLTLTILLTSNGFKAPLG